MIELQDLEAGIEDDLDSDEAREVLATVEIEHRAPKEREVLASALIEDDQVIVEIEHRVLKVIELQDLEAETDEVIEDDVLRDQVPNLLCKISSLHPNQREEIIEEESSLVITYLII